jgi:gliding motility-associated-like protein
MKKILAFGLGMLLAICGNAQSASDAYAYTHLKGPRAAFDEPGTPVFIPADSIAFTGVTPAGVCPGSNITLHALHSQPGSSYQWTLNGLPIAGATDSVYIATAAGDYSIVVVNGPDTYNWPTLTVVAHPKPVPDFSFTPTGQCSSTPISFSNLTSGSGNTYLWDFNDPNSGSNNSSTQTNPAHFFAGAATGGNQNFPVKLYATNSFGCVDSVTKTVATVSPGTNLGGSGLVVYNGNPVFTSCTSTGATLTFLNQSTTSGTNIDYAIVWGDASANFTATTFTNVNHTYATGTYTLSFIVNGAGGCRDTGYYMVYVGSNPAVGLSNPGNTVTCSESSLTFPITSTGSNSPGTTYTVTFNDPNSVQSFSHPAPASVSHTFLNSSCGTTSTSGANTYPNSFSATIKATNPCGSSSASIVPIYVSKKPKPVISISPKDTVCTNVNVTISNNSGNMQSVSNGVCSPGKAVWSITPATGWTVTGNLGNSFNSTDPALWIGGSGTLNVVFTTAGTYTVKMLVGNTSLCPIDSTTRTICVSPQAVADFVLSSSQGCGPLLVNASNNSNTPNCGSNTYAWTVTYNNAAGCTPATGSWSFTGGTAAISPNPAFSFVNPGVYSLQLQTTAPGGTCSNTLSKDITVKSKPNVTLDAPAAICVGPYSPVATANDCFSSTPATYLWTFNSGTPATATVLNPTTNYNAAGTFNVQLDVTNECGTTSVTQPITITPTPVVNQPADITICNTSTAPATVFTSPVNGLTFNWTNSDPSIGLPASGTGDVPSFVAVNTGTSPKVATITITPSSTTCSGPTKTFTITVNPTPPIDAGPDRTLCAATFMNMAAVLAPATTGTWSQLSGPAANIANPTLPATTITGLAPLNIYQFVWTVNGSGICTTVRDTVTVINRPLPTAASAGADTLICDFTAGNTLGFTLHGNAVGQPWEQGAWTEVASANTTGLTPAISNANDPLTAISNIGLASGTPQGSVTLVWAIANDAGCTPSRDTVVIRVVRKPVAGTIAPTTELCNNSSVVLTASGYEGNILKWRRKDAPLNTNPYTDIVNNTATLSLSNLLDSVAIQFIVVSPNPSCTLRDTANAIIPVSKPIVNTINGRTDSVCTATPYLSNAPAATGGNGTAPQYQWQSSPNGITFTDIAGITTASYDFTPTTTIWLRRLVTIGNCSSISDTIKVWVEAPIANNTIAANQTICVNTAPAPLAGSVPSGGSAPLGYTWESSTDGVTWTAIAGATAQNYSPGALAQTTYFRRIVSSPRCPQPSGGISNVDTVSIIPKPTASFVPSTVTGCSPLNVTFTNNSLGAGATYTWYWGDNTSFTTTSTAAQSHTFTAGTLTTFHVKLVAQTACGIDSMMLDLQVQPNNANLNVTVSATELAGCGPHTVTFYNSTPGASSFQWNFNDASPVLNTTRSIDTVIHTFTAPGVYNVSIRATNSCTDTTGIRTITVYPKPTAAFTPSTLNACVGNSFTFTNNSTSATSYLWRFSDNTSSSVPSPTKSFSAPGTYTVKLIAYNVNGTVTCADSIWMDVTVGATQTGSMTVSATTSTCSPLTVDFANNTTPNTSVLWNFGDGTPNSSLNTVSHTYTTAGNFQATLTVTTASGCTYVTTQNISVGGPSGQLLYTGGVKCDGRVQFDVTGTGATSYSWDFGNSVVMTTTTPSVNYTYSGPGVFLPQVTLNGGGCAVVLKGTDSVRIERMVKGFNATFQNFCDSTRVNFQDTSSAFFGKSLVQWNFGSAGTATGSSPSITLTNTSTLNVMMVVKSNSGCTDTTRQQVQVNVWNTPNVTMVEPPNFTGCARQPQFYDAVINSTDAISNVQWQTNNGITGTGRPFQPNFATPGVYNVTLTVSTVNSCTRVVNSNPLTINPTPTVAIIDPPGICRGGNTQINVNVTGTNTYNWSPVTGLSCTTCPSPTASPDSTTTYILTVTNGFGCSAQDTTVVTVTQPVVISVTPSSDSLCIGDSVQLFASGATTFTWTTTSNPGDLSCSNCANPVFNPSLPGEWMLTVTGTNSCFTQSRNIPIGVGTYPSVNLGPDLVLPAGTVRPLTSTVTGGPITSWSWTPATNLSCSTCPQPSATVRNEISYVVTATTSYGCTATDTLTIHSFCEKAQAYIPNAFSPDGDGINDVLMVRGSGIVQVKSFRIFNRWGEVVYERANFPPNDPTYGWDGKVKGTVTGPDVYVYTAEVICENGITFTYKGNVSVLK